MTLVTEGVSVFFSSLASLVMGVPLVLGLVALFCLTYAQVIWAQVAIAIVVLLGPVFIPWLLFEPLAFLFWGWFRTLMVYTLYGVVAGAILRVFMGVGMGYVTTYTGALMGTGSADPAVFVYVDPGHETTTVLRSWAVAHRGLWQALTERCCSVEVVAVVRTRKEVDRARTILDNWAGASAPSGPDPAARREIARIEKAILDGDDHVLGEYGDLQAGLKRIVELKEQARVEAGRKLIRCGATWQTVRLARVRFR